MRVRPPRLARWMVGYIRAEVAAAGIDAEVGTKEPDDLKPPRKRMLIVIRDDSGPRQDWTTFGRSLGVTILGGTRQNDTPVDDLADLVASIMFDADLPLVEGCPIASVEFGGCNGPYPVPDPLDIARRYLTAQYVVTGSW